MESSGLLDIIAERTANTELYTNKAMVKESLSETLKVMAKREKLLRESTIMFKISESITPAKVTELIETTYCFKTNKPSASYLQDKEYAYAQFISQSEKEAFLEWIQLNSITVQYRDAIQPPNDNGEHMLRKPIRVVINNVRRNIKEELVEQSLKRILGDKSDAIQKFKAGKPNDKTGARSIMFSIDGEVFKTLFGSLEGSIPYVNTTNNIRTKLFLKINCKPWACRDCFAFGIHQCEGKLCAKCSNTGHATKDCKSKTKYCRNCKHKGHKARDTHCMVYMAEVAKELRKICIPIEYFEDKELRSNLIKHIQIN